MGKGRFGKGRWGSEVKEANPSLHPSVRPSVLPFIKVHELGTQWKIRAGAAGSFENYTDWCRGEWGRKVREGGVEGGVERWIKC